MERSAERSLGGQAGWTPADGLPDIYIAMGQTAENVRELEGVSRQEMDEFAVRSQERAVASIDNGFFEREIVPVTLPDGIGGEHRRRSAPGHHPRGPVAS